LHQAAQAGRRVPGGPRPPRRPPPPGRPDALRGHDGDPARVGELPPPHRRRARPRVRGRRVVDGGHPLAAHADRAGPARAVPRLRALPVHRRGAPAAVRGGAGHLLPLPPLRHRLRGGAALGGDLRPARGAGGRRRTAHLVRRQLDLRRWELLRPRPRAVRSDDDGAQLAVLHPRVLGQRRVQQRRRRLLRWRWWRRGWRRPLSAPHYLTGTSTTRTSGVPYVPSRPATSSTTDLPGTRGHTTAATYVSPGARSCRSDGARAAHRSAPGYATG